MCRHTSTTPRACRDHTTCTRLQYVSQPPSTTQDRICSTIPICNAGYYRTSAMICEGCSAGTHSNEKGQTACKACRPGRFTPEEATNKGYVDCKACQAGQHQDETGQIACKDCEAGTFAKQEAQYSCHSCEPESYQDQKKQSSCVKCDYTCPGGQSHSGCGLTQPGSCSACAEGRYKQVAGTGGCTACESGKFQPKAGQFSCNGCGVGR